MSSTAPTDSRRLYFSSLSILLELLMVVLSYQRTLCRHVFFNAPLGKGSSVFSPSVDVHASVQIYSLSLIFKLWSSPHYRSSSYKQDCIDNLKNVAIPGTGVPLSFFCHNYYICLVFVLVVNPLVCLLGAINKASHDVFYNHRAESSTCTAPQRISPRTGMAAEIISKAKNVLSVITALDLYSLERFLIVVLDNFVLHLLHPDDWFSLWQMNCRLASYHSLVTKSPDYSMEDKWTFLVEGKGLDVPVSPFMTIETLVCKNKNIEGGMGIHFFKNATCGGDWILQEKFKNADWLSHLLPLNSPLSTMRIITSSRLGLSHHRISSANNYDNFASTAIEAEHGTEADVWKDVPSSSRPISPGGLSECDTTTTTILPSPLSADHSSTLGASTTDADEDAFSSSNSRTASTMSTPTRASTKWHNPKDSGSKGDKDAFIHHNIKALSAVLRLGRAGASTDHSSVLFDVDMATGRILQGMTNAHWYKLGVAQALVAGPWLPPLDGMAIHPDPPHPQVTGQVVPGMQEAIDIVVDAHFRMMPEVPIVGWDVAFTPNGVFLLEVNLSCNFFKGTFDLHSYISFVSSYFRDLEQAEAQQRREEVAPRHYTSSQLRSKKVG